MFDVDVEARLASFRFRLTLIHSFFAIRTHCRQFQGLLKELQPQDLPSADVVKGLREEMHAALASLNDLTKTQDLMDQAVESPPSHLRGVPSALHAVVVDPLESIPESEREVEQKEPV